MNHGRLAAAGPLDDLVGSNGSLEDAYLAMTEEDHDAAL
jgi:hypothetical protein